MDVQKETENDVKMMSMRVAWAVFLGVSCVAIEVSSAIGTTIAVVSVDAVALVIQKVQQIKDFQKSLAK